MQRQEIINFLRSNKRLLKEKYKVSKIGIFGSFAREENTNESDIDIIVSMPSDFDNYYDLKEFLEQQLNSEIDLALEKNIRNLIRKKIQDEVIYV
jgi:hypothetical protein